MKTEENKNIPFFLPSIGKEEEEAVLRVMKSGWLTTGKEAIAFENEFANYIGSPHCLAVNSNTSGLLLAMEACGIKEGTKILTTPYTFISTATTARHLNGEIEYADIEKNSYNIDPEKIEDKLKKDKSIKAIIPVHIAGNICKMNEIMSLSKKYNVTVIEDAAHAFPSKTNSGYAGTIGDIGVFSFYATKTMTTGEGGMITTKNPEFAKRMSTMRMHGIDRTVWDRYTSNKAAWEYDIIDAGYKFNLPDVLAAMGREQLKKTQSFYTQRTEIAKIYNKEFAKYDFLELPPTGDGNAWHIYILSLVPEKLSITRNEFSALLQEKGIGVSMHFIPHFRMTYIKNRYNISEKDFPNAERQFQKSLSIPLWPDMKKDDVQRVIDSIVEIGTKYYGGK